MASNKLVLAGAFFGFVIAACGGTTDSPSGDGGTNDAAGDGGGGACPSNPPTQGAACATDQLACEYGSNPDPSCNQLYRCNAGAWQEQSSATICLSQTACPTSYASVPLGQDCTSNGLACGYPQGECICTTSSGGLQKPTPSWECFTPPEGCPNPRPDLGTSCASPDLQCDYGACSGGIAVQCKSGVWTEVFTPCPA